MHTPGARAWALLLILACGLAGTPAFAAPRWWPFGGDAAAPTEESASYGLRFVDPRTGDLVDVPFARLAAGERHLLRVALYAMRDGQLDPARQWDAGPNGAVKVACTSSDAAVIRIEPAESYIVTGFEGAFAQFWVVGIAPGQAKVTATGDLGNGAKASTWFGPVTVGAAPVATPRRIDWNQKAETPPAEAVEEPGAEAPAAEAPAPAETTDDVAAAAPEAPAAPAPAEPVVAAAPTDTASPAAPAPSPEPVAAAPETPTPPAESAPALPVVDQPEALAALPAPAPEAPAPEAPAPEVPPAADVAQAPPAEAASAAAPAEVPAVPAEPGPPASEVVPGDEPLASEPPATVNPLAIPAPVTVGPEPPAEPAPPPPPPLNELLPAAPETVAPAAEPPAEPPAEPRPAPRVAPAPVPPTTEDEPPARPCRRVRHLLAYNVTDSRVQLRLRDAGADQSYVYDLAPGDQQSIAPGQGKTLWVSVYRPDGERRGSRIIANELPANERTQLPQYGEPWLVLEIDVEDCAP